MAIDAIGSVGGASSARSLSGASSSKLSDDTKKQLIALGLDPTKYSNEADAKAAISDAKEKRGKTEGAKKSGGSGDFKRIEEEAQALAAQMGISVDTNKINDVMRKISDKVSELESSAGSDKTKLAQANDFSNKYSAIANELAQLQATKNMTGATALGNYNKASLGL